MPDPLAGLTYGSPYPYPTGYASIADVQARISAGSWDPTDPTASPNPDQVNDWLMDATAALDATLGKRGYAVPLAPPANWTNPTGLVLYHGVGVQAWRLLRSAAAAYATHLTEAARHGSQGSGTNEDRNASYWLQEYRDFVCRVEAGKDNLTVFGVGGPFTPDPDPAKAASSGSLGMMLADPNTQQGPMFTKGEDLGGGWERTTPTPPPSGPPFGG